MRWRVIPWGAAALALASFAADAARADQVYAFAQQQIESLTIRADPGPLSVVTSGTDTGTAAVVVDTPGGSEAHLGNTDALQSYVGPGPRPPENFNFGQNSPYLSRAVGMVNPDYARGDVLIAAGNVFTGAIGAESVAESFLQTPISGASGMDDGFGDGEWSFSFTFDLDQDSTLTFDVTFNNIIDLLHMAGLGSLAQASTDFAIEIQNSAGMEVFTWDPDELNLTNSLTTPGSYTESHPVGSRVSTSTMLAAGLGYVLTISGGTTVNTTLVPEPSSIAMLGLGGLGLLGYGWRRRVRAAS